MKTNKKEIVFIVNPISGTKSKDGLAKLVEKTLDADRFNWKIVKTEYAGHAAEITTQCVKEGVDICVAVGGDGTVNEVARSLVHSQTALGIIPCGSGNGLARHLCLPMSMKGAVKMINEAHIETFDYGLINNQPFFCTCGMGFDAHVSLKFSESGKRGLSTYAKMVLKEGIRYQPETYTITFSDDEGEHTYNAFLVACANAAQYGNNTYIAPQASMQDGLLDVIIIDDVKVIGRPKLLTELFTKTLLCNRHTRHFSTTKLHIHRNGDGAIHFDGDPMMAGTDFDIELRPLGLRAITNPKKIEDKAKPNAVVNTIAKVLH